MDDYKLVQLTLLKLLIVILIIIVFHSLCIYIVPPTVMVITEKSILVTQPAPAMFMCSAIARPRSSITWYRVELNGSRTTITGMEDEAITLTTTNGSSERTLNSFLNFTSTQPFLSAMYVCVATNPVDSAEDNATLTVYGEGERWEGKGEG